MIKDASLNDRIKLRVLGDVGVKIRVLNFDSPGVQCVTVLQGHTQDVKMVSGIHVWILCSLAAMITLSSGHCSTVWALSFNAEGDKMVSCSDDLTLKIWEANTLRMESGDGYAPWSHVCTLSGYHDRTIFSVHWSREGIIASGAADDAIRLFVESKDDSIDGPSYKMLLKKEKAHDMDVNSVQWNPVDHRLLASGSDDGTIKIWELASTSTVMTEASTESMESTASTEKKA